MNPFMTNITRAFVYVTLDPWFFPAMTFTTIIGIFIGSVIYNGDFKEMKKGIILLISYVGMITLVTLTRVMDDIFFKDKFGRPLAGIVTILLVTVFYLLGMYLGIAITKQAHRKS